jgi:hypothetical protein
LVKTVGRVWLPAIRLAAPDTLIIADGFSCRERIEQRTGPRALHLAEILRGDGSAGGNFTSGRIVLKAKLLQKQGQKA